MAGGVPEPDVDLAYHATDEERVDSIVALGLLDLDTGGRRAEDPDEPKAVYLFGEDGEGRVLLRGVGPGHDRDRQHLRP
jgi:hypothetical protein